MINRNLQNKTVGMVSLGCSKNQVDAERLLGALRLAGYAISSVAEDCGVVIINTCGFIESAKQEAIDTILEFAAKKQAGQIGGLIVTGCLSERYREEFMAQLPEVDGVLGIGKNAEIVVAVDAVLAGQKYCAFGEKEDLSLEGERMMVGESYTAYLKVAEGCDNRCSYCAIPDIRGRFRSRPIENILAEARELVKAGVVELNLVAQDTTRYGEDIYGELALPRLLERLCEIEGLGWVRLLYCYPERVTDRLLDVIAAQNKIVNYIDLPVQHASGKVLSEMNRRGDAQSLTALTQKIRAKIPDACIRTTLITGFPGESEEDFEILAKFVKEIEFDRLGCFAYSQEEGTPAGEREDQLDEEVKRRRAEIIMETQARIAEQKAAQMIGKEIEILVEGHDRQRRMSIGRSRADAPDVDGRVYYKGEAATPGSFVRVKVTGADGYDLIAERV
ncbi:MAG: 30S ribosomal protein S12 methylthiotransferase RimO [Oscillospiraceae bacterium]|nr:30S ribosomal protein S12 methylthiotransferase RimO [Oscillospiraceae bacterium]